MRVLIESFFIFVTCAFVEFFFRLLKTIGLYIWPGTQFRSPFSGDDNQIEKDKDVLNQSAYGIHWSATKPVLLCISVGPIVPHLWSKQIEALSEQFSVIPVTFEVLLERRFQRRHFKLKNLAQHCVDVARSQGAEEFIVMAHGAGTHLAWAVGQLHPKKIKQIIIISGAHPSLSEEKQALSWKGVFSSHQRSKCFIQLPFLPLWLEKLTPAEEHELYKDASSSCVLEEEDCSQVLEEITNKGYSLSTLHYLRNISVSLPLRMLEDRSLPPDGRVQCPVLFIIGSKDPRVSTEEICYSGQFVDKFYCNVVDGASSYPHWEKPEVVNSCITSFLSGVPTMSTPKRHQNSLSPVDFVSNAIKGGASAVTSTMYNCVKSVAGGTLTSALQKGVAGAVVNGVGVSTNLVKRALF